MKTMTLFACAALAGAPFTAFAEDTGTTTNVRGGTITENREVRQDVRQTPRQDLRRDMNQDLRRDMKQDLRSNRTTGATPRTAQ